jgi:tight adherence protein C
MSWEALDLVLVGLLAAAVAWMYYRQARELELADAAPAASAGTQPGPTGSFVGRFYTRLARQAGFSPRSFLPTYWIVKAALAIVPALLLRELGLAFGLILGLIALAPIGLIGFFLPDAWLLAARRSRRRTISAALSHFLDMIVALTMAGISLEEAFRRAARVGFAPRHPLAEEVELIGRELEAGEDPAAAFRNLAERTGVPGALGIASALRLGTRVGASVRSTLEAQAELLWHAHVEDARRRINTAALGATLGVMLCGFPVFAVFALFPVITDLIEVFRVVF